MPARQAPTLVQIGREQRDQLVAVDDVAGVIDCEHAIGVPVEGDSEIGPSAEHLRRKRAEMGRAAPGVDVHAVGRSRDHRMNDSQTVEHGRRHSAGRAVGAVDDDATTKGACAGHDSRQPVDIGPERIGIARDRADDDATDASTASTGTGPCQRERQLVLDGELVGNREFRTAATEQLEAVVTEGIVRRRDHGRRCPSLGRQPGETGGGNHACVDDVTTLGGEPSRQRRQQHRSGATGVAAEQPW